MASPLITQADLEAHRKPKEVRAAACDDGSGVAGQRLTTAIATASSRARMILGRAWRSDVQVEALVAGDDAIKGAVCDMAFYELTKGQHAWISADGKPLLSQVDKDAVKMLNDIADAELRPSSEQAAGANPLHVDRTNVVADPQFVFAPTASRPNPGGY